MKLNYEKDKKILLEKSQADDSYIKELKSEVSKYSKQFESLVLESKPIYKSHVIKKSEIEEKLYNENELLKAENEKLEKIKKGKLKILAELEEEIASLKNNNKNYDLVVSNELEYEKIKSEIDTLFTANISKTMTPEELETLKLISKENAEFRVRIDSIKNKNNYKF